MAHSALTVQESNSEEDFSAYQQSQNAPVIGAFIFLLMVSDGKWYLQIVANKIAY